jgi:hypothetical protein
LLRNSLVQEEEEEESTPKASKRGRKSKTTSDAPTPKEPSPEQAMPTVAQLCQQYGLKDVDLEYSEADYSNLTTYKLFLQTFRYGREGEGGGAGPGNNKVKNIENVFLV